MNLTVFKTGGEVFTNCECIKGYAFKLAIMGIIAPILTRIQASSPLVNAAT